MDERKKLKWFLGFVIMVLLITAGTDFLFSFYGSPNVPKERNPFMTVDYTPTPASASNAASQEASPSSTTPPKGDGLCTMDAKMCPDGKTFVGRSGPNCEFMACPKKDKRIKNKE